MHNQNITTRCWPTALRRLSLIAVLLLVLLGSVPLHPAAAQSQPQPRPREARVGVTLEANPNLYVAAGTILAYKLRAENYSSSGIMHYARVFLAYDPNTMTLIDAAFDDPVQDYIAAIDASQIEVFFGSVGSRTARFAVLYMQLNEDLPIGTILPMWGRYTWEDRHGNYGLNIRTNSTPVIVQEQNVSTPYVWMAVEPQVAPVGTPIGFFTDRLLPDERVWITLTKPDGTQQQMPQNRRMLVTPEGNLWLDLDTTGLPPGEYSYVVRGDRSRLEAAASFTLIPK
ncbi:MAG: hypothetical protein HC911_13440 [Chloroflexaceae bacterium]|nr:hypothetical protein [Chloroflexaceae bacterium]